MSVIADAYCAGVSTGRVEKLVQQLGMERMSKSQVSRSAKSPDQIVGHLRTRSLDGVPYAYVTLDALVVKSRERGRNVDVCVVHAVGATVTASGSRSASMSSLPRTAPPDSPTSTASSRAVSAASSSWLGAHRGLVGAIAATRLSRCCPSAARRTQRWQSLTGHQ